MRYFINTLWLVIALVLVQQLAEHWLLLSRRRIAYKAALERRKALQEQRAEGGEGADVERAPEVEEPRINLVALSKESRKLLTAAVLVAGAFGLWFIWSGALPALELLDKVALWQQSITIEGKEQLAPVTLNDLLTVLLIILVSVVAALGVGIGFGLQEIVANFICGLIILFEQPIRVGDYVTVGETDGTVTRIRIRATTILTRERKELLVPNKEFITGRLLNWSLSDQSSRLEVPVGIAYGADVELAEKLLLEAAQEHPRVQEEPAPFVYFDQFGDSALQLELRCVIDSLDYRITVLSELHHAINRKFRTAGMPIPFPQRDVHLDLQGPLEVRLQPAE